MHKIVNYLLVLFVTVGMAFVAAVILEVKIEHDKSEEMSVKYKQVQPFYWWSVLTHDGVVIGGTYGPLKLSLHPFATTSNFPNQSTDHFTINSMGFRETGTKQRTIDRKKIVLLGGSTAFGTGLNGDDETIARFLEDMLGVEVINAAVIGHASGQELAYLLTELTDLGADLVLSIDGHNDFSYPWGEYEVDARILENPPFGKLEQQLKVMKQITDPSFLKRVTNFYRVLFPGIIDRISQSRLSQWFSSSSESKLHEHQGLSVPADIYAKNITKMSRMSASFHYNFLCALQPDKERSAHYRSFRELAKAQLRMHRVNYLDLNDMTEWKDEMFMDNVHTNKIGNKLIAERIAEVIKKEQLLLKSP